MTSSPVVHSPFRLKDSSGFARFIRGAAFRFSLVRVQITLKSLLRYSSFRFLLISCLPSIFLHRISLIYCRVAVRSAWHCAPRYPHGLGRCNLVPNSVYSWCVHCLYTSYPQPTPPCSIPSSFLVYHLFTALRSSPFLFAQKSSCTHCTPAFLRSSLRERAEDDTSTPCTTLPSLVCSAVVLLFVCTLLLLYYPRSLAGSVVCCAITSR